jgi:hypothetical protein
MLEWPYSHRFYITPCEFTSSRNLGTVLEQYRLEDHGALSEAGQTILVWSNGNTHTHTHKAVLVRSNGKGRTPRSSLHMYTTNTNIHTYYIHLVIHSSFQIHTHVELIHAQARPSTRVHVEYTVCHSTAQPFFNAGEERRRWQLELWHTFHWWMSNWTLCFLLCLQVRIRKRLISCFSSLRSVLRFNFCCFDCNQITIFFDEILDENYFFNCKLSRIFWSRNYNWPWTRVSKLQLSFCPDLLLQIAVL